MKMTAGELKEMGIIDRVIPEYPVLGKENINRVMLYIKRKMTGFFIQYLEKDEEEIAAQRYGRFREM